MSDELAVPKKKPWLSRRHWCYGLLPPLLWAKVFPAAWAISRWQKGKISQDELERRLEGVPDSAQLRRIFFLNGLGLVALGVATGTWLVLALSIMGGFVFLVPSGATLRKMREQPDRRMIEGDDA